ncbi:hypothetical protein [Klebsiella aerogenes]|uniref:hypothetical protein n=1 Tax=Klebsiella aerogenes TaxID=548 RepID=UPI001259DCE7|nr:hypothetical protein [Klebsiella aerogenes]VAG21031.1 Uncharacterised protein [Klebsiella aerogenes]
MKDDLVSKVRDVMNILMDGSVLNTKVKRTEKNKDIYKQTSFNFDTALVNLSNRRGGTFNIQYLYSSDPVNGADPYAIYDTLKGNFDDNKDKVFNDNGLKLITTDYVMNDMITDPQTGSQSINFAINIKVIEKRNYDE